MKPLLRIGIRTVQGGLMLLGLLALLLGAAQFTNLPWRAYRRLAVFPAPSAREPTHILVMGGSGIPGASGLMRTYYGALAAAQFPDAELLVAMPLDAGVSAASQAYLDELRRRGVLPERMRILPEGRNTREQALRLAERLGDQAAAATVLIVSDPAHIRRTAASLRQVGVEHLAGMPAEGVSIEDPLSWRAAELELHSCTQPAPVCSPARRPRLPDIGGSLVLRYSLWNNLSYTHDSLREHAALAYYRLRGWI